MFFKNTKLIKNIYQWTLNRLVLADKWVPVFPVLIWPLVIWKKIFCFKRNNLFYQVLLCWLQSLVHTVFPTFMFVWKKESSNLSERLLLIKLFLIWSYLIMIAANNFIFQESKKIVFFLNLLKILLMLALIKSN